MIDGDYSPGDQYTHPYRRYPEVEGCTDEYVSWQYVEAGSVASQYDLLHYRRIDRGGNFQRPPGIIILDMNLCNDAQRKQGLRLKGGTMLHSNLERDRDYLSDRNAPTLS